nr:PREDICTED: regulator of microtubule dynamics protein 1-like isoform X2 [Bemisia tabaci]
MNVDDFLRHRGLLLATLGTGVIIGATSTILYHHIISKKEKEKLHFGMQQLEIAIRDIRSELERLRSIPSHNRSSFGSNESGRKRSSELRRVRSNADTQSITTDTMYSVVNTDDEESEFYDFSSDVEEAVPSRHGRTESESEDMLRGIDHLLKGSNPDKIKAYGLLLEMNEELDGKDPEVLWRLSKVCHLLGQYEESENNNDKYKQFIESGIDYGKQALELNNRSPEAHKWYAVNIGSKGRYSGTKEKIQNGYEFKRHIDEALKLKDDDPILHHLLARFQYEVAILSAMERRVAKWLFSEVPEGKVTDAIAGFLKAEALNADPWKENEFLLAKCYIHEKQYQDAAKWLDKALKTKSDSPQDIKMDKEISKLLSKYTSYLE